MSKTIKQFMEDRGDSTDAKHTHLPQENMHESVLEEYILSDGSRVAFTENCYVISHQSGHEAGEDFATEQPIWADEIAALRASGKQSRLPNKGE